MIAGSKTHHLQLNQHLQNYLQLNSLKKAQVRRDTIKILKSNVDLYEQFLAINSTESSANLLYGSTGVGKSSFYNFVKGFPLILINGKDKNEKLTGQLKLDVQAKSKLNTEVSPIEHGFMSGTAIPHVCKVDNTMIFDLPGEFQNRCILQAMTSAVCRQKIAQRSKQIKVTILINYNDLFKNRGSSFKQVLQEVNGFVKIENSKELTQMFTLVVTQVPPSQKKAVDTIKQALTEIVSEVVDFGKIEKQVIQSIAQRNAIAVFFAPAKKIKAGGSQDEIEYENSEGLPYKPDSEGSIQTTLTVMRRTNFAKCENSIFSATLNPNFKITIDNVCKDLIEEIKSRIVILAETNIKSKLPNIPASILNEAQLASIDSSITLFQNNSEKIQNSPYLSSIEQTFSLSFDVPLRNLKQDLNTFVPLSSIYSPDSQLKKVSDKVINLLQTNRLSLVDSRKTLLTNLYAQRERQAQQQARLKAQELQREQQRVQNQQRPQRRIDQKIIHETFVRPAKQVQKFFRKLF